MPRSLRIEFEGAVYHLLNRGDRREAIFKDDQDRESFLDTLGEAAAKTGWQVHAYCLMNNHFHVVVETPQANLVAGMKWFLGTYTIRFNRRHKLSGHLFAGRYKSLIVDASHRSYFRTVCEYVHLNPARAALLKPEEPLQSFRWSSFRHYLARPELRPKWLRVDRLLGEMRIADDTAAGRQELEAIAERRRTADSETDWNLIRRGWCLGNDSFRAEVLAQVHRRSRETHYAPPKRESTEATGERLVREELNARGWSELTLGQVRKGDPGKIDIARRLRTETAVTLKWIANRLNMGKWTHVANCLYAAKKPNQRLRRIQTDPRQPTETAHLVSVEQSKSSEQVSIVRTEPEDLPVHCL